MLRIDGALAPVTGADALNEEGVEALIFSILDEDQKQILLKDKEFDFSFAYGDLGRFRVNAFHERGNLAAALRLIPNEILTIEQLGLPEIVNKFADLPRGLVLVTGPTGSGKSTSLAALVHKINAEQAKHIITIEDPIEFIHAHQKSVVSQREVEHDTESYKTALRAALRQSPNVILLGEMRDLDAIQTALTAAETGQLVLSTLHTVGAAKTIDRIIDVFPANQQQQIRIQLSMVLRAVVSQQLLPTLDGGLEPAFEIMLVNSAIQNMIRDGKSHQMDNVMFAGASDGMRTMDGDIYRLYLEKRISKETALLFASNQELLKKKLSESKP